MFKVVKPDSVLWPVKVLVPKDGGGTEEGDFNVRFKFLGVDKLNTALALIATSKTVDEVAAYILDWDGLVDEGNNALVYSKEILPFVVDIPYMIKGINKAFIELHTDPERKN